MTETLHAYPWIRGLVEEEITRGMPCTIFRGIRGLWLGSDKDEINKRDKDTCIWWAPATIVDVDVDNGIAREFLVRDEASKDGRTLHFKREWKMISPSDWDKSAGGILTKPSKISVLTNEHQHPFSADGTRLIVGERHICESKRAGERTPDGLKVDKVRRPPHTA